jgi:hypothetical protein
MRNFEWSELTPREHLGVFFGLTPSRLTISIFDSSRRTAAATALSADGAPEFCSCDGTAWKRQYPRKGDDGS